MKKQKQSEKEKNIARLQILEALSLEIAKERADAIAWRENSGIEKEWIEDEEHYEGIDDCNRNEMSSWTSKPVGQADPSKRNEKTGSTVFMNITRPYCDVASARVGDMLLPTDDRNWSITPTPLPELVNISKGKIPGKVENQINDAFPDNPDLVEKTKNDLVEQIKIEINEAKEKAERAQERIDDWHVESQYHSEVRQLIEDCSKSGSGILKGPYPIKSKSVAYVDNKLVVKEEIKPTSKRISYWNFFPAKDCGHSIHNGSYVFERDYLTSKDIENLIGCPGYFPDQIVEVLREGPHNATKVFQSGNTLEEKGLKRRDTDSLFEVWYYNGRVKREILESIGVDIEDNENTYLLSVGVQLTMVNNRVIKSVQNYVETDEFPYDVMVWQRRQNMPWGIGVSRQLRTIQRMVNATVRNMMDNAGFAGGPMWAVHSGIVQPLDGVYCVEPLKGWITGEDADIDDVKKAFTFFEIPMMQDKLLSIIQFALKMAEEITGLPMFLQGQQGSAPDTVGGMIMMHNNASTVLRRIARLFDDLITEPHIRRYYQYLLVWGEDNEKGDFQIDARGSSALVERDMHNQFLSQVGNIVTNPMFGKDPKKWINEFMKSQRVNPSLLDYDDEEWQKIVQSMSKPAEDPALQIAQMKIEHEKEMKGYELQLQKMKEENRKSESQLDREISVAFESLRNENDKLKEQGKKELTMAQIQARLTETVMKLDTQEKLSGSESKPGTKQVLNPPSEPAGRAPNGQAYQK